MKLEGTQRSSNMLINGFMNYLDELNHAEHEVTEEIVSQLQIIYHLLGKILGPDIKPEKKTKIIKAVKP